MATSISFSSEMAILAERGIKTQTRRLKDKGWRVGDVLRVSEPWGFTGINGERHDLLFRYINLDMESRYRMMSANSCPWILSRFSIRITRIRQELLDDILTKDAKAEGFATRDEFFEYFQKCYPDVKTVYTPVFVIEFEVVN